MNMYLIAITQLLSIGVLIESQTTEYLYIKNAQGVRDIIANNENDIAYYILEA